MSTSPTDLSSSGTLCAVLNMDIEFVSENVSRLTSLLLPLVVLAPSTSEEGLQVLVQYRIHMCAVFTCVRLTTGQELVFKAAKVKQVISDLFNDRLKGQVYDPVTGTKARPFDSNTIPVLITWPCGTMNHRTTICALS